MDYTEAEIVDTLLEMGYMAPEDDTLHGIRSKLSSTSYLDEVDINELLTTIFDSSQIKPKTKTRVSQKYASLMLLNV
uniref:Uncharacterized protein n=1 Tax=Panagrolaimus sp. JU765 TaxID=591449 RepID=A0AC34QRY1_9BILA